MNSRFIVVQLPRAVWFYIVEQMIQIFIRLTLAGRENPVFFALPIN